MIKKNTKIEKLIARIKNPKAPDNFIITYSDFLLHRESLPYYQFNPNVLENLLDITLKKWRSTKRISRMSLLENIKRYTADNGRPYYNQSNKALAATEIRIRRKLFIIFRHTFEETSFLSSRQVLEAQKIANGLLINVALGEMEEEWLCANYKLSEIILNRLLRYPAKSKIISAWAEKNFQTDSLRNRRAELLSWLLDENPKYQLNQKILWEDYQYFNSVDQKAIQDIKEKAAISRLLKGRWQDGEDSSIYDISEIEIEPGSNLAQKDLVLSKRFYRVPIRFSEYYLRSFPDFKELHHYFIVNFGTFLSVTKMWAIGYSRLNKEEKSSLLIGQYSTQSENTFFKICEKCKLTEPLEWLKMEQL